MDMFIGREKGLDALESLYKSNKFEFVVIYGRRRVGKTALINHFTDDKKSTYFLGVESNESSNQKTLDTKFFQKYRVFLFYDSILLKSE